MDSYSALWRSVWKLNIGLACVFMGEKAGTPCKKVKSQISQLERVERAGMLFLDDSRMKNFTSCFKEKKFLHFFFTRLRLNTTDRYHPDFPFISPCGRERNFVRCDDQPFVYTHVLGDPEHKQILSYGHAGDLLTVPFQPDHIFVHPVSGRVYHPAPEKVGGIGLVRSQLAIET
ncbi:Hypothetical predicted protein [Cloeon dipterum]|uniref:Uncharacterized protein n=1 Tax=Cloeon dipterum TaxID=197152 RepID=A0A8S1CZN5_9INSE|nr:Hypothetical predicted protein [Cloeon dipterum]